MLWETWSHREKMLACWLKDLERKVPLKTGGHGWAPRPHAMTLIEIISMWVDVCRGYMRQVKLRHLAGRGGKGR